MDLDADLFLLKQFTYAKGGAFPIVLCLRSETLLEIDKNVHISKVLLFNIDCPENEHGSFLSGQISVTKRTHEFVPGEPFYLAFDIRDLVYDTDGEGDFDIIKSGTCILRVDFRVRVIHPINKIEILETDALVTLV